MTSGYVGELSLFHVSDRPTTLLGTQNIDVIPELAIGNNYPGTTYCVQSCGGPGCDCFYWSSSCLFYRVYAVPTSNNIFELFHCARWKQSANIEVTFVDHVRNEKRTWGTQLTPNVPVTCNALTFTLGSITVPPTLS
ncbi:hypothetical protein COOONC_00849 [Cooperia oncophora]